LAIGIGIDVYGTLVDPLGMNVQLQPLIGASAARVAELWRAKQLEYTFRRAAMGKYENFDVCTRQALVFVLASLGIKLPAGREEALIAGYQHLQPYPDTLPGLAQLRNAGYDPVVFSNGVEATLRELLGNAGILAYMREIVSVDELKTFKPDPRVYHYLAQRLRCAVADTWLVSSNSFDVLGAKAAGLKAAWIRRDVQVPLDAWELHPDLIGRDLVEFAGRLADWR
jgi:2-haloacid dehalogenase